MSTRNSHATGFARRSLGVCGLRLPLASVWTLISESMLSGGKGSKETAPTVWPDGEIIDLPTAERWLDGCAVCDQSGNQMLHGSHVRNAVHGWRQPSSNLSVTEDAQGRFNIGHRPRSRLQARGPN